MKRHLPRGLAVLPFLLLLGCGKSAAPTPPPPAPANNRPAASPLEAASDVSLADLLTKPRAELAGLCDEYASRVQFQEKAHRDGTAPFLLLPDCRLPLMLPIWREARFSVNNGISLPPYLADGATDSACAVHLARHGDVEAALKLVDPADAEARRRIEAAKTERNYAAEWTRLVALMLQLAQYRLATGDPAGAQEIVALHRQLQTVLDAKAANGPLGADLLARGRHTLAQAARAWRAAKNEKLGGQIDASLGEWGPVPAPAVGVTPGQPRVEAARVLGSAGQGRLAAAASSARAFDLFALPFPSEGAQGVFAFFDEANRLTDVLIAYRARMGDRYPEPGQLALALEDHALAGADAPRTPGLRGRTYTLDNLSCAVTVLSHSSAAGACVRFSDPRASGKVPDLGRDFGAAHLQRSFEQNRLRLAPELAGPAAQVDRPHALAQLRDPLRSAEAGKGKPPFALAGATLQRDEKHDLLDRLTLRYKMEQENLTLPEIARPLWTAYGPGRLGTVEAQGGSHLALTWEDAPTRYVLTLPNSGDKTFALEADNRHGPDQLAKRAETVAAFDQAERVARLKEGKPLVRLPRQVEVEWTTQAIPVELGMTKAQAQQALPSVAGAVRQEVPDGLRVLFTGNPAKNATHVLRELYLRWDSAGRLGEIRARYEDGPAPGGAWAQAMLNDFRKRCGAAPEGPGSWAAVWSDLPPRKPAPVQCGWRDDVTRLAFQRDGSGVELVLCDCPASHPAGLPLPPLECLPRGPEGVALGDMREELLRRWNGGQPQSDGSVLLTPAKAGPHDAILVWFDKGRVERIMARHRPAGASPGRAADAGKALVQAWGREGPPLGWPRRQDFAGDQLLQGLGWHDDRARVRLFWQESNDGTARVFTEWKTLAP